LLLKMRGGAQIGKGCLGKRHGGSIALEVQSSGEEEHWPAWDCIRDGTAPPLAADKLGGSSRSFSMEQWPSRQTFSPLSRLFKCHKQSDQILTSLEVIQLRYVKSKKGPRTKGSKQGRDGRRCKIVVLSRNPEQNSGRMKHMWDSFAESATAKQGNVTAES
jgi:hypothetical protein